MARVFLSTPLSELAGVQEIELDADNVRGLVRELESRFPPLAGKLTENLAVAVDGDIISSPMLYKVNRDSEVHFIPAIEGG